MKKRIIHIGLALVALIAVGCSQEDDTPVDARHTPMRFEVTHPSQRTRVTDSGFENGDRIGLFASSTDKPLEIGGNLVNNEPLTCSGSSWTASRTLYWDEGTYNFYAYYPYMTSVSSIEDLPFSVQTDRARPTAMRQRLPVCTDQQRQRVKLSRNPGLQAHNEQAHHTPDKG